MARKPTGKPIGPPPKQIDFEQFEQLCGIWCTTEEIAALLKICAETLRSRVKERYREEYSVTYKRFFDAGTPSFRRDRRVLAKKNTAMSIWLGKVHLGEKDFDDPNRIPQKVIVQVNHDGLGSGLSISAQAVPNTPDKSIK
jgi:hypothetical protein